MSCLPNKNSLLCAVQCCVVPHNKYLSLQLTLSVSTLIILHDLRSLSLNLQQPSNPLMSMPRTGLNPSHLTPEPKHHSFTSLHLAPCLCFDPWHYYQGERCFLKALRRCSSWSVQCSSHKSYLYSFLRLRDAGR